jgi:hypothetical protein
LRVTGKRGIVQARWPLILGLKLLHDGLWVAQYVLLSGVIAAMVRRKSFRQFPVFFAFAAFEIFQFLVLFICDKLTMLRGLYGGAYTIGLGFETVLLFGVIYEIYVNIFRHYSSLERTGRAMFRWGTILLLLGALLLAVQTARADHNPAMFMVFVLDRTANILQCGLLICLFLFSSVLGISWRNYAFGIALGLGLNAAKDLAKSTIVALIGNPPYLDFLGMGIYCGCVIIWLFYLWGPERSPKLEATALPAHDMEVWSDELQRLLKP